MLVVAGFFAGAPMVTRWYTWSSHSQALGDWAAQLKREHWEAHAVQLSTGQCFSVHIAEVAIEDDGYSYVYSGQPIRQHGYFVVPPGKWVDSVPDIIDTWEQHRR